MRVLHIVFLSSSTEMSGTYLRPFFFAKYLVKEGHKVLLIGSSRKPSLVATRKVVDGVNVFLLPSLTAADASLLINQSSGIATSFVQTVLNCLLEFASDFDVLHSFDVVGPQNAMPTLCSSVSRFLRIHKQKIFVDWNELWGRGGLLSQYQGVYRLIAHLLEFLEEKVPLLADAVSVSSESLKQHALWAGIKSENLFKIPNGANIDFIKPFNIYDARKKLNLPIKSVIYTQAGILDMNSLRLLMTAHKKVARCYPNAVLLLVGLHKYQIDYVNSLTATRNVVCVGRQPYHRYALYLGASDVLLLPLQDSLYNRSRCGMPGRLGDYLAAGRPIIATALAEIGKVVCECGFLARPGNPNDFAGRILEFIEDPDLCKAMGKRARKLAETEYSWQIFAKQLEKVYNQYL